MKSNLQSLNTGDELRHPLPVAFAHFPSASPRSEATLKAAIVDFFFYSCVEQARALKDSPTESQSESDPSSILVFGFFLPLPPLLSPCFHSVRVS